MRDGHAFRRHGVKQHERNLLPLCFFKRRTVARRIKQIECKTIRTGGKRAVDNLVLLNNVCALGCRVDDFNIGAGLCLECSSGLLCALIHLVKPGMNNLWHDDETIAVFFNSTRSVLRHGGNRQRKGSNSRQHSKLIHTFLPWKSDETSSRLTVLKDHPRRLLCLQPIANSRSKYICIIEITRVFIGSWPDRKS